MVSHDSHTLLSLQNIDQFDDVGPCVIMASPGMMQSGLSRQLFEAWCTDKRNGVIVAGYCVEGTLAKVINNVYTQKRKKTLDSCVHITLVYVSCDTSHAPVMV